MLTICEYSPHLLRILGKFALGKMGPNEQFSCDFIDNICHLIRIREQLFKEFSITIKKSQHLDEK